MGLDIYFFAADKGADMQDEKTETTEIHYWRKHNRLMDAMSEVVGESIENCTYYPLTADHLYELERRILDPEIQLGDNVSGFFWGGDYPYDEETKNDDLEAVAKALQAIADGQDVYFWAWW